jgi:hypothetical protein
MFSPHYPRKIKLSHDCTYLTWSEYLNIKTPQCEEYCKGVSMVQQWHFTDVIVAVIFSEVRLGWCYFLLLLCFSYLYACIVASRYFRLIKAVREQVRKS